MNKNIDNIIASAKVQSRIVPILIEEIESLRDESTTRIADISTLLVKEQASLARINSIARILYSMKESYAKAEQDDLVQAIMNNELPKEETGAMSVDKYNEQEAPNSLPTPIEEDTTEKDTVFDENGNMIKDGKTLVSTVDDINIDKTGA
jgi:hypothetical protein